MLFDSAGIISVSLGSSTWICIALSWIAANPLVLQQIEYRSDDREAGCQV